MSNGWWGKNFFITRSTLKFRHMQNRFGPLSPRKRREYTDGRRGRGGVRAAMCQKRERWIIQRMLINILCNTRTAADIDLKFRNCCCGLRLQALRAALYWNAISAFQWGADTHTQTHTIRARGVCAIYWVLSRVEQASILQIVCYCSSANININAGIV